MYGSMQKPHDCGLLCNLSRPVFGQRLLITLRASGRNR